MMDWKTAIRPAPAKLKTCPGPVTSRLTEQLSSFLCGRESQRGDRIAGETFAEGVLNVRATLEIRNGVFVQRSAISQKMTRAEKLSTSTSGPRRKQSGVTGVTLSLDGRGPTCRELAERG
jgi:hypothetical protein